MDFLFISHKKELLSGRWAIVLFQELRPQRRDRNSAEIQASNVGGVAAGIWSGFGVWGLRLRPCAILP